MLRRLIVREYAEQYAVGDDAPSAVRIPLDLEVG
jgi:hypothetical protein